MRYLPKIFSNNEVEPFDEFDKNLFPSVPFLTRDMFDPWKLMEDMPSVFSGKREKNMLKTDIREKDDNYVVDVDMPGCKKEDVHAELNDGYLTVRAERAMEKDEKDADGKYLRQERFFGTCARSFYVGEQIKQEDIKAKFENGILTLVIPKKEQQKELPKENKIVID